MSKDTTTHFKNIIWWWKTYNTRPGSKCYLSHFWTHPLY